MPDVAKVLDIEAVGEPWEGGLICVGWGDDAYELPLPGHVLAELASPDIAKIVFTKYDHRWLRLAGYVVAGPVIDVQVMCWTLNETTELSLDACTHLYTPHEVKRKRIGRSKGVIVFECDNGDVVPLLEAPIEEVLAYNKQDLRSTMALYQEVRRLLHFNGMLDHFEQEQVPFTRTLVDVECAGVPVDVDAAKEFAGELQYDLMEKREAIKKDNDLPDSFNVNSGAQLQNFLYKEYFDVEERVEIDKETRAALRTSESPYLDGMPVTKVGTKYATLLHTVKGLGLEPMEWTETRQPATDSKTLQIHYGDVPAVQALVEVSSLKTLAQTTLPNIIEQTHDGRLYGRFNQTGTKTGRLSSNGPNLQNIPARGENGRRARALFRPEPGMLFVHGDYSQLEPRLMAHFSHDPILSGIYAQGRDIYVETAERIFRCTREEALERRGAMKVLILALGYGSGAKTIRKQLALYGHRFSLGEVEEMLEGLKRVYSTFWQWKDEVVAHAEMDGYVETLSGHRRHFFTGRPRNFKEQASDARQAVNAVIQGSAADIVAKAMRNVPEPLTLLLQVHDELLWEVDDKWLGLWATEEMLQQVQRICENEHGYALGVPLVFEPKVVTSWAEGKD